MRIRYSVPIVEVDLDKYLLTNSAQRNGSYFEPVEGSGNGIILLEAAVFQVIDENNN
jgi:hypothetical protein